MPQKPQNAIAPAIARAIAKGFDASNCPIQLSGAAVRHTIAKHASRGDVTQRLSFRPMDALNISTQDRVFVIAPTGNLTAKDIISIINEHYPSIGARSILWDLRNADFAGLSEEEMSSVVLEARRFAIPGVSRKTAYAITEHRTYVRIWKYVNKAVSVRMPAEYAVFVSLAEAMEWLGRG